MIQDINIDLEWWSD